MFFRNNDARDVVKGGEKLGCWKVYGLGANAKGASGGILIF